MNSIEGIVWEADVQTLQSRSSASKRNGSSLPDRTVAPGAGVWKDHMYPEDRDWAVNLCVTAAADKRDHDFEYRMVASDGRVVWLRDLVSVVVANGQAMGLRGVMFDVTARRQAEEALREQASLLDLTHDTIFVRDMNDMIRYWNRGAEELYGWRADEAVGRVSHELMQTIFSAPLGQITAQVVQQGRGDGGLVHAKRDGTRIVVASRWSLQRDAGGRPVAIVETNNDVTEPEDRIVVLFSVSFPPPDADFDAVLVSIMDITDRKKAEQELEQVAGRLINAQEAERSRIGRELHDYISQMLGVLTVRMDQLRADETIPPAVAGALAELRQRTTEITDDIHGLSHRLHSSALDYLGLAPALKKLLNELSALHGIAIAFEHAALPPALPSDVALCLFRVTEESLTNIAKHSHAKSAGVYVNAASDGIHLVVEDSGRSFDLAGLERGGLGFVSMRERLRVLHGTVRVDSAPSHGTRIHVWVPATSLGPRLVETAQRTASPEHASSNVSSG